MRRGRRPAGLEYVDQVPGSAEAKKRARMILATMQGLMSIKDACQQLDIGPVRFHELRKEFLLHGITGLEPRPAGRPVRTPGMRIPRRRYAYGPRVTGGNRAWEDLGRR